ncbi:hypothetical protein KC19_5G013400, partial [Ceratodon purpureus]
GLVWSALLCLALECFAVLITNSSSTTTASPTLPMWLDITFSVTQNHHKRTTIPPPPPNSISISTISLITLSLSHSTPLHSEILHSSPPSHLAFQLNSQFAVLEDWKLTLGA